MPLFGVTVSTTKVEKWVVAASSEEEAVMNYEEGDLVDEDTYKEVSEVFEISD